MTRSRPFRRARDGSVRVSLEPVERALLADLAEQMQEIAAETEGPMAARLYPAAYPEDDRATAEFAELTTGDLLAQRLRRARRLRETVEAAVLDEEDALSWLGAINDIRLALGVALGIEADGWQEAPPADPRVNVLEYLGYLEGTLLEAL